MRSTPAAIMIDKFCERAGWLIERALAVAFLVAAMFLPIAYQFYFFSIGGLAVALRNIWHAESAALPVAGSAS